MEYALGHFLTFQTGPTEADRLHFQNHAIGETASWNGRTYQFLPFGYSGITFNRNGDNADSQLVFPNNKLTRPWILEAVQERWIAVVRVMILDPGSRQVVTRLTEALGRVVAGDWDDTMARLTINGILDGVGGDLPPRCLFQKLVGALPFTANVGL